MTQSSLDHKGKPDPLRSEGPCFHTANFLFSEIKAISQEKVQSEKTVEGGSSKVEICSIQNSPFELP